MERGENNKKQRPGNYCKANSVSIVVFANLSCLGTYSTQNKKATDETLWTVYEKVIIFKDRCQIDPFPVIHKKFSMKSYCKFLFKKKKY